MTNDLDKLTAERVMGYTIARADRSYKRDSDCGGWSQRFIEPNEKCYGTLVEYWREPSGSCFKEVKEWCPASDIAAAFEVVDAMHSNGWRLALEWFTNRYRAHFANSPIWDWHFNGEHLNPATAICLSALRAVGVSEDEIQAAIGEQK